MAVLDLNSNLDVFSMQTFLRGLKREITPNNSNIKKGDNSNIKKGDNSNIKREITPI
jgi:hypothetical protein